MPFELTKNSEIIIYLTKSFSEKYLRDIAKYNKELEMVKTKITQLHSAA